MVRQFLLTALTVSLMLCLPLADCWGRGFGGGGGGGGGGRGGAGGGGAGGGGRGGAGGGGGFSGGAASAPDRGQLNSFLGLPSGAGNISSDGGAAAGFAANRNNASQYPGQPGAATGAAVSNRNDPQYSGAQGAAAGATAANRNSPQYPNAQGAAAGAAVSNRNSPDYSGAQGAAAGAAVANRNSPQYSGAAGAAAGYATGSNRAGAGFNQISPSALYGSATAVRGNFNHWDVYGAGWHTDHPGAWFAAGWGADAAWRTATWNSVGTWMSYYPSAPVYYDYGNNVTYQDNSVYVNGQEAGTSEQFYDQATELATTGSQADASAEGEWLPLGVFALTKSDQTKSNVTIQLAVNKQGIVRGNYTDTTTDKTQLVQGSVDKQSQRVAFTVGENTTNIVETGLYNLTKDEAPALIHFGKDRTEQWLLVRLKNQDASAG